MTNKTNTEYETIENKTNSWSTFFAQTLMLFAVNILILMLLAAFVGDGAKELSPLYQMGSGGLATSTMLQFLLFAAIITAVKDFFFSDRIFKKTMALWRTILMLFTVLLVSILFILIFHWFPVKLGYAWAGFLICFGGSCIVTTIFMIIKTKWESKHYNKLLSFYKEQHEGDKNNE